MNGMIVFRREGDWLVGVAELARQGRTPQRIEARANLRQIAHWIVPMMCRGCEGQIAAAAGGDPAAVGFFGKLVRKIGKAVKKVAKGKVFRQIGKVAKGAVRYAGKGLKYAGKGLKAVQKLPGFKYATMAAAAAFPPLGVPALAALQGANAALAAAEQGGKAARQLQIGIRKLSIVSRGKGPAAVKARKALKVLRVTHRWRRGLHAAQRQITHQAVRGLELPPAPIPVDLGLVPGC